MTLMQCTDSTELSVGIREVTMRTKVKPENIIPLISRADFEELTTN